MIYVLSSTITKIWKKILSNNNKYLKDSSKKVLDYFNESLSDDIYLKDLKKLLNRETNII